MRKFKTRHDSAITEVQKLCTQPSQPKRWWMMMMMMRMVDDTKEDDEKDVNDQKPHQSAENGDLSDLFSPLDSLILP